MAANVFFFLGASSSGKTESLRYLHRSHDFALISKQTTRLRRDNDGNEVENVSQLSSDCDVRYTQYGVEYGFQAQQIWDHLSKGRSCCVVINDIRTLRLLKRKFGGLSRCIYIHSNISTDSVLENEARRHSTPGNPQVELHAIRRAEKIAAIHRKYIENSTIFDATVLNIGDLSELYAQLDTLASLAFYPVDRERVSAKVFVICGNSFSGKDQLINAMQQMQRNRAFIYTKGTTREKRASDGGELAHMPADAFPDTYDITYEKQGHTYGISTAEIWHGLSRDRVLLVAINDAEIIVKMKQIFGQSCVVLYLHFDQIADELEKQEGADIPANELMLRLSVAKQLEATYFHNLGLFDHVLLNTTNIEDLYDQAFNVYDYYCL